MELPADTDTIVVIAPRLPEAPGERVFSTTLIDPAELEQAIRVDDALRTAPGVSLFRRNDSAAANPTIQGLSLRATAPSGAGRVLVTLDGAPLNDPFGGWVIWGAMAPETLARATIIRGAGAGAYGAGALLGAVQLQEREDEGFLLSAEAGERGHWRVSGFGAAGDDAFSLGLAASVQHADGFVPVRAGRGAVDAPIWFDGASASARVGWRGEAVAFSARVSGYDEERGAGLVGAQSRNSGHALSLTLAQPDGPLAWRVQAWLNASDLANSAVAVAPDRSFATPANDQLETPTLGLGLNAALRWTGADAGLEIGADVRAADGETRELFRFVGADFTRSRTAGGQTWLAGVYAEAWAELGDTLISGGARLDRWRAFDAVRLERDTSNGASVLDVHPAANDALAPTARFGVRHALDQTRFVRGAIYAGFRPPTLNELHRPFRVGNDVTEANVALEPERLIGADAAIGADAWSVGVFATRLEDAIVNVTLGAGPGTFPPGVFVPAGGAYRQRQNAGAVEALGLELEAHGEFAALSWRAALNAAHARMAGGPLDGKRPAQAPAWSATAGIDWRLGEVTLAADLLYESRRFEDDLNSRELAPASVLDLRVERRLGPAASVFIALDNALDAAVETAETAEGLESFGPPRALRLGVRVAR